MPELYCPSIFTRTPAFERVVLVWKFQTDKLCAVWLSKLFNQFIGGNKLMLQCCKTVCPISLFICVILFKRWRIFSLLFKHGALLPTSDGNASLTVFMNMTTVTVKKSQLSFVCIASYFLSFPALKALMYAIGKNTAEQQTIFDEETVSE